MANRQIKITMDTSIGSVSIDVSGRSWEELKKTISHNSTDWQIVPIQNHIDGMSGAPLKISFLLPVNKPRDEKHEGLLRYRRRYANGSN